MGLIRSLTDLWTGQQKARYCVDNFFINYTLPISYDNIEMVYFVIYVSNCGPNSCLL